MTLTKETRSARRNASPSATSLTTNLTWTDLWDRIQAFAMRGRRLTACTVTWSFETN